MIRKRYINAKERVETREYPLEEAVALLLDLPPVKFNESVDLSMRLGVDPKYPDQMVRGTVVLPHGVGRVSRFWFWLRVKSRRKPSRPAPITPVLTKWSTKSRKRTGSSSTS